jgi:protein TonB
MRRVAEIAAFLGLSAAVHAGVIAGLGDSIGGAQTQGDGGADRVTLQAAPESLATLAERWTSAPEPVAMPATLQAPRIPAHPPQAQANDPVPSRTHPSRPPELLQDAPPIAASPAPAPTRPTLGPVPVLPEMPLPETADPATQQAEVPPIRRAPPALTVPQAQNHPDLDTAAPPPPGSTRLAAATSPRPSVRPFEPPPVQVAAPPQPARVAAGAGGGATQGASATTPETAPALSAAQRQSLMSQWGLQIMARIERARPRVSASGQVVLAMQVARSGQLAGVSVAQSSGDPALDAAALSAVRRAGRFPAAPDALTEASYGFSLPIRFR